MNKPIKIMFTDIWFKDPNNNRFINKFRQDFGFDVEIDSNNPDYILYSIGGDSYKKYTNAKKIFICWEPINIKNDIRLLTCDYSVTYYSDLEDNIKHFYFTPIIEKSGFAENFIESINKPLLINKQKFCCFIISNGSCNDRNNFFKKLCFYKKVDSFGGVMKNCDVIIPSRNEGWDREYLNVIGEYKFMITFENNLNNGVITEKIYNAFKANTVPIYWGNKEIYKIFNKGSFINVHDFSNFEGVIEYIKKVDNDDNLYNEILNSVKLNNDSNFFKEKTKNMWEKIFYPNSDIAK